MRGGQHGNDTGHAHRMTADDCIEEAHGCAVGLQEVLIIHACGRGLASIPSLDALGILIPVDEKGPAADAA